MPWFIYCYPFPKMHPASYILVPDHGEPECNEGEYLGAIKANVMPNTIPAQPDLNTPGLAEEIINALRTKEPSPTVKLRPSL